MAQDLRQRKMMTGVAPAPQQASSARAATLSAPQMLRSSPQQYQFVMKLRIPLLFSILPQFLQKIICQYSFLSFLAPSWERRFLILLGGYLYKFTNNTDPDKEPKGTPLAVDTIDINLLHFHDNDNALRFHVMSLPPGCEGMLEVSTLRKRHIYATPTSSDAETWVHALQQAREEAIKRRMGHTPAPSYPPSWKAYDTLGQALAQRKERIHRRLQESRIKEFELSSMTEGATAPRGYFG